MAGYLGRSTHNGESVRITWDVYGVFLKWWYPTTMGFHTKNDHFGMFPKIGVGPQKGW